jgi:hypothetical protein
MKLPLQQQQLNTDASLKQTMAPFATRPHAAFGASGLNASATPLMQ